MSNGTPKLHNMIALYSDINSASKWMRKRTSLSARLKGTFCNFLFSSIELKMFSNLFQQGDFGGNVSMASCWKKFDTEISSEI
jgi:hypothetical protein